ncbi:hypothetical protein SNE40_003017 [Patella caerulea]|uniref:Uncharacterized protein n=1 Tax=Patella caerulea TaxID=87958 RepID=A0AAN8K775_PATCE
MELHKVLSVALLVIIALQCSIAGIIPQLPGNNPQSQPIVTPTNNAAKHDKCSNKTFGITECHPPLLSQQMIHQNYTDAFSPACTRHDICYKCGKKFHRSRDHCEVKFLEDMTKICETLDGIYDVNICGGVAGTFYAQVFRSGKANYHEIPLEFCSEFWVAVCMG